VENDGESGSTYQDAVVVSEIRVASFKKKKKVEHERCGQRSEEEENQVVRVWPAKRTAEHRLKRRDKLEEAPKDKKRGFDTSTNYED